MTVDMQDFALEVELQRVVDWTSAEETAHKAEAEQSFERSEHFGCIDVTGASASADVHADVRGSRPWRNDASRSANSDSHSGSRSPAARRRRHRSVSYAPRRRQRGMSSASSQ